jgi:hypothetical protein
MAVKVATANLTLPNVPHTRSKISSSPLATAFEPQDPPNLPNRISSRVTPSGASRPAWPSQTYASSESVLPPNPNPTPAVSQETLLRMQSSPPQTKPTDWKPPRPNRPPSPGLLHQRTLSHTLSPELVELIRSPGSGGEESSPKDKPRLKGRSGSISLKGLKSQMSGKNLNGLWKADGAHAPMPSSKGETPAPQFVRTHTGETVGLFKGPVDGGGATTSFASLRSVSANVGATDVLGEFGTTSTAAKSPKSPAPVSRADSLPSKPQGLASRILSFGRKTSNSSVPTAPAKPTSKRNLSVSGPLPASFVKNTDTPPRGRPSDNAGLIRSPTSPKSPTSPRSVKRKPVPKAGENPKEELDGFGIGIQESDSLPSMRSFVLEDPPIGKRRVTVAKEQQDSNAVREEWRTSGEEVYNGI